MQSPLDDVRKGCFASLMAATNNRKDSAMLAQTFAGVLIPREMENATDSEKQAYADKVKSGNRAFIDAYFAIQDRAAELGIELDA